MFPLTRISIIQRLQNPEQREQALDGFVKLYWVPIYKYLRMKWNKNEEDAKDLTQAFFLRCVEKNFFNGFDSKKARFRTFLRVCLDGFVANERKSQLATKRGGHLLHLPMDFQIAENELKELQTHQTPEKIFEQEWARSLFRISLEKLAKEYEEKGKSVIFRVFERYEMEATSDISYKDLASEFEVPVSQITNYLADARKQFRRIVLETLEAATATEEEYRSEVRALLGLELE
jgi:RNA polymerase sigma factor (sigma-70 family)